jgi:protoporphyrinogen/coproporphyrinogen III oxidase
MLGTLDAGNRKAWVIGGGISGLLIADALDARGYEVTLSEKKPAPGGLISTQRTPWGISESAAHSLLVSPAVEAFFSRIDVPLSPIDRNSRARFILRGGRMRRVPLGPLELASAAARAYFTLATRGIPAEELSLADWASRHLGPAARDYLFTPLIRGIYGAEPEDISVGAAFPSLFVPPGHSLVSFQLARLLRRSFRASAPPRSRSRMMVPRGGMSAVVDALAARLRARLGDRLRLGEEIRALPSCENLIIATPAAEAAALLREADPELSARLDAVRYTPLVSVTAFVDRGSFHPGRRPRGVGVLIPRVEGRAALGVLFNSSCFPGRAASEEVDSFTVMLGGLARVEAPESRIRETVENELKGLFGGGIHVREQVVHRWPRAIPRYGPELPALWAAARSGWCRVPGRVLFGNYTAQVSLRGMIELVSSMPKT